MLIFCTVVSSQINTKKWFNLLNTIFKGFFRARCKRAIPDALFPQMSDQIIMFSPKIYLFTLRKCIILFSSQQY